MAIAGQARSHEERLQRTFISYPLSHFPNLA